LPDITSPRLALPFASRKPVPREDVLCLLCPPRDAPAICSTFTQLYRPCAVSWTLLSFSPLSSPPDLSSALRKCPHRRAPIFPIVLKTPPFALMLCFALFPSLPIYVELPKTKYSPPVRFIWLFFRVHGFFPPTSGIKNCISSFTFLF